MKTTIPSRRSTLSRWLFIGLAVFGLRVQAQQEARTALVVGVTDYRDRYFKALDAPVEDAKAIGAKLETLGFQTQILPNPTRRQLTDAVDAFGTHLARRGGVGLFYFSGHGAMKSDEDANYLIPAGTNIRTENDLPEEAFNAQRIANRMKEAKCRLNLIFLDACRDHGLPHSDGAKGSGGGLAAMRGASGLMFFFATQPGEVAIEDSHARRSVFTAALLSHMDAPGLSFMDMMSDVTAETERISLDGSPKGAKQSPFVSGTLSGRFYFRTDGIQPAPPNPPPNFLAMASKEAPFVNSLGEEFVPVPGTNVLFCRWDTRLKDFRRYAEATNYRQDGGINVMKVKTNKSGGRSLAWEVDENARWEQPGFAQTGDHPVVGVNWNEARAFCAWLSKEEGRTYRLPTDEEWSAAVGADIYPWGNRWPPHMKIGNYADASFAASLPGKGWLVVPGLGDGYARTSPVGSFSANRLGLYDMGGNVWQWCEDEYRSAMNSAEVLEKYPVLKNEKASDGTPCRVLRGGSWDDSEPLFLRSTYRDNDHPRSRFGVYGFRCVLVVSGG